MFYTLNDGLKRSSLAKWYINIIILGFSFLPADTPVLADGLRLAAALPVGGEELAAVPAERLVVLAGVELGRGTHAPEFTGKQ